MRTKPFRVLSADPPWPFGDKLPGGGRGAEKHYQVMSIDDIAHFKLPPMHDDSLLFLWRVAAMQQEALHVMQKWGYTLKSEVLWVKTRTPPAKKLFKEAWREKEREGYMYGSDALEQVRFGYELAMEAKGKLDIPRSKLAFGMGRYTRQCHEVCLIGARGKAVQLIQDHSIPSVIFAPRQAHSAKPEAFYDMVEQLAPGPYAELFARRRRRGWTCKGNEL